MDDKANIDFLAINNEVSDNLNTLSNEESHGSLSEGEVTPYESNDMIR